MCEKCQDVQVRIDQFRRLLTHGWDALTTERLLSGLAKFETQKAELHPEAK